MVGHIWDPIPHIAASRLSSWLHQGEEVAEAELLEGSSWLHEKVTNCWCTRHVYAQCQDDLCACFTCKLQGYYPTLILPYFFFRPFAVPEGPLSPLEERHFLARKQALLTRRRQIDQIYRGLSTPRGELHAFNVLYSTGMARGLIKTFLEHMLDRVSHEQDDLEAHLFMYMRWEDIHNGPEIRDGHTKEQLKTGLYIGWRMQVEAHVEKFCGRFPNKVPHRAAMIGNHHLFQLRLNTLSHENIFWKEQNERTRALSKILSKHVTPLNTRYHRLLKGRKPKRI